LLSSAAIVRLQSVIEKPGPFKDVSKGPEYIFVGLMSQFVSMVCQWFRFKSPNVCKTYLAERESLG
jgi:hypothetical protein